MTFPYKLTCVICRKNSKEYTGGQRHFVCNDCVSEQKKKLEIAKQEMLTETVEELKRQDISNDIIIASMEVKQHERNSY